MTAKKRLAKYLKINKISQYEFSRRTGLSNGYLNSGDNVTSANLDVITNAFRDLNLIWIVKGVGPMTIPRDIRQPTIYPTAENTENLNCILNEDYINWLSDDSNDKLSTMTTEQLIEVNKAFRMIIRAKNETIQAKDGIIATLEQVIIEKEHSNEVMDKLIRQLEENQKAKG